MAKALLPPASFSKLCSSALRARKVQPSSRRYLHPSTTKKYYSYEHPQPPPFPPAQTAILSASLAHVPAHGFTLTALRLGAQDAGYPAVSTNLFPRGAFEIVYFHLVTQRLALGERVQFHNPSAEGGEGKGKNLAVEEKVRILSWERLCANKPIIHRWQKVPTLTQRLSSSHSLNPRI